ACVPWAGEGQTGRHGAARPERSGDAARAEPAPPALAPALCLRSGPGRDRRHHAAARAGFAALAPGRRQTRVAGAGRRAEAALGLRLRGGLPDGLLPTDVLASQLPDRYVGARSLRPVPPP